MRRSQWFVFAIAFLLLGISAWKNANHMYSKWEEFSDKELKTLEEAMEEKIWSEQDVVALLRQQSSTHSYWSSYEIRWEFSNLYMAVFFACTICGFIERRAEKKR